MKKIHHYVLLFTFALIVNYVSARELTGGEAQQKVPGAEKVMMGTKSNIPEFIQFRAESRVDFSKFNSWAHATFSLSSDYNFKLLRSEKDQLGMVHFRYQETYRGFPMEGTMYIVHVKNGRIVSANGNLIDQLNVTTVASMSESSSLSKALDYMHAESYRWQNPLLEKQLKQVTKDVNATWFPKGELMLAPVKGMVSAGNYHLAYRFDIYAEQPLKREYVFIDAASGEMIYSVNRIQDASSNGTAVTAYSGTHAIVTDSINPTTYYLRDASRGGGVETYNLQQGTNYVNTDFVDNNNNWNNVNAQLDQYATDAHWGAEMTYDFFQQKFGRNSIDDAGLPLLMYVHYSTNFVNAFWDGSVMTFGDGDGTYAPLTTLDVTGHEISHGLTQYTSNLGGGGSGEPGALNEGFSDCMGNSIRHFGKQSATIDWLVGDEMGGAPFRDMANPNSTGNPDTYLGTNWDAANQEVHQNSTILSHWFYLLTEGGSGTNDNGDAYTVGALGIEKAQAICFRMNTVYLVSTSGYADARTYAIQAAIDLFGPCTNEVIQTVNAWHAVGVGNVFSPVVTSDFAAPVTLFCSVPATVAFANQSSNGGTFTWDFGDGSAFSHLNSPVHVYSTYGHYDVKLIADGGSCGIDSVTKPLYISVDSLNPCIVSLPVNGTGDLQTACSGQLFDNGGPSANYQDQTDAVITIAPTGASSVSLTFSSFNLEDGFDYLYVYDGPSAASTLIGQYTGTTLPNGGVITSTGGSITVRQTSDQALNFSGFALVWQCTVPDVAPTAAFTANTTSTCTGAIQFTDHSTNGPSTWNWHFGDGDSSSLQNPLHTYLSTNTYTVTLKVTNAHGNNTLIRTNYISVNLPAAPVANTANICTGTSTSLTATGSSVLTWYNASTGGTVLGTGSTFNTPVINSSTNYYVESDVYPAVQHVGPVDNTFGGGGNYSNSTNRYLIFNCLSPVKLISVYVYAQGTASRTIRLVQNGTTLQTTTVNIPDGASRVTLNFDIPVGTNFSLECNGIANLYRNNASASFPYTLNGVISITATNAATTGFYYYFYDWELQQAPCISPRTVVHINADPVPVASYNSNVIGNTGTFTDNSTNAVSWFWSFGDPVSGTNDTSSQQSPAHTFSGTGTFNVCLYVNKNSGCRDSLCQNTVVNPLGIGSIENNSDIAVYPNPVNDLLTIHFSDDMRSAAWNLKLIDVLGKIVDEKFTGNMQNSGVFKWEMSSLAPGAYLLLLESKDQKLLRRIIRQ